MIRSHVFHQGLGPRDRPASPVDGQPRVSDSHVAYFPGYAIDLPDPLRHVNGFPVLGLLPGLRRHGADPNGISNPVGDLAFHIMQRSRLG